MAAVTDVRETPDSGTTIDAASLKSRIGESGLRLLDVRTGAEFETAHIAGSYHVPLDTLSEHCADICGTDDQVVVVCQSGVRAAQAARTLAGNGLTTVKVLEGGVNAWVKADGPVIRGTERWALERQVRGVAGSIALTSILASTIAPKAKWGAGFIGAGLTFSALSNTCAMGNVLSRLPYNQVKTGNVDEAVSALVAKRPAPTD